MTVDDRENWDLYLRRALFAFSAHKNSRLGCSPFYLQYGVEPILPSMATIVQETPLTNGELETAKIGKENSRSRLLEGIAERLCYYMYIKADARALR